MQLLCLELWGFLRSFTANELFRTDVLAIGAAAILWLEHTAGGGQNNQACSKEENTRAFHFEVFVRK